MRSWKIALALVCCAAFAACSTQDTSGAASGDPGSCRRSCDGAYDKCAYSCEQKVDNNMCSDECIDALDSCKRRCG
jgi:hypothetical protein